MTKRLILGCLALALLASAQRRVDPRNSYFRVICVVPLVGSGTTTDPKRPQYTPWPSSGDPDGIIGYYAQLTDDGRSAVVECVARSRAALQFLLSNKSITALEKDRSTAADINAAIQHFRKDFDIDKFGMVMP